MHESPFAQFVFVPLTTELHLIETGAYDHRITAAENADVLLNELIQRLSAHKVEVSFDDRRVGPGAHKFTSGELHALGRPAYDGIPPSLEAIEISYRMTAGHDYGVRAFDGQVIGGATWHVLGPRMAGIGTTPPGSAVYFMPRDQVASVINHQIDKIEFAFKAELDLLNGTIGQFNASLHRSLNDAIRTRVAKLSSDDDFYEKLNKR